MILHDLILNMEKMKKYIILISALFILPYFMSASTLYVSTDGDDDTARPDDPDLPFLTLQAALDQTSDGDTVRVASGTYPVTPVIVPWYEPLPDKMAPIQMIRKCNITIEGEEDTLIQAPGAGDVFVMQNCTNIVIHGLNFESDHSPVPDGEVNGSPTPLIHSMILLRNFNDGIDLSALHLG